MNINSFLDSLASNNSRNFKIEQLNAHSDNEVILDKLESLARIDRV